MPRALKTALTLLALAVIVAFSGMWGWARLTQPLPQRTAPQPCTDTPVKAGDRIAPEQVTLSVYNASKRVGLAGRTANLLEGKGFDIAETDDAPAGTRVVTAQVWVEDASDPAAKLVQGYLGAKTKIRERAPVGPGITVVVGSKFEDLAAGEEFVVAAQDGTVCSPTG